MRKKAFLFINLSGDFLSIHQRIEREGHECYSWYSPKAVKGGKDTGRGLIDKVDDHYDILNRFWNRKDELVVMIDDNSHGSEMDLLRKAGFHVVGSSETADDYEHERDEGNKLASQIGLKIPPTKKFTDFNAAREFIRAVRTSQPDARFVFKANGVDLAGSSKTYVSRSLDDLEWFISWVEKDQAVKGYKCDSFILQLVIEGMEADFACWFNGEKFAPAISLTFEQKKLHDLGAAQGCYGQILTFVPSATSRYFTEYMANLPSRLSGSGPNEWAINNIVSTKDGLPYFLEWTPRFGWDSTFGELALLQEAGRPLGEFFTMIAYALPFPKDYFPIGRYSCALRLFSESHGSKGEDVCGKPISWRPEIEDSLWFYSLQKHEDDRYSITDNPFAVITACGDTPDEAMAKCYAIVKPANQLLVTPDLFHSEFVGEGVPERLLKLREMGWI